MASLIFRNFFRNDVVAKILDTARWFRTLHGYKRLAVTAGLGAVSAVAFAPFYLWPLWLFTFPAFAWIIDGAKSARRPWIAAAQIGWAFGFAYFLIGLHWIGFAFVVDADKHGWLLPFVAILFPGGLALFFAVAAAVARIFWSNGPGRLLMFAASLSAAEWLRGHVLTGLPWNLPGELWGGWDAMFQSVSIFGLYGLSLVTLLIFLLPAAIAGADGKKSGLIWPPIAAAGLAFFLLVFGWARLPSEAAPVFENIALRIVQPNIPQAEKWKPELMERNWKLLVDLTRSPGLDTRTVVIWPEAAPPFLLLSQPVALDAIGALLPDQALLLTGTVRSEEDAGRRRYFNSMTAVSGEGRALATYDKAHLVPFGEYLPLFQLLEPLGITKLTGGSGGYAPGAGVRTLEVQGTPSFGVLICYELIFPGAVVEPGKRPQWLVTMTDDSWFGPWTGPYQHLGIAKIRAAEEGISIVRAANTGVSAIIDPYGRVVTSLGLDQSGFLDGMLPKPLKQTVFSWVGDLLFGLMLIGIAGVGLFFSRSALQDG